MGVGTGGRQLSPPLRLVEHAPGVRDQHEAAADESKAQEMERPEVRVDLPAEQHLGEVAGIVGEPVDLRVPALQPPGEEVDGQGKPYISVNSATMKALKAPKERQSRFVRGLKKLKAKMMNTAELMMTSDQRP